MNRKPYRLEICERPDQSDRESVLQALVEYNRSAGPPTQARAAAILLRDPDGRVAGGLWGKSIYDWLVIELFVVPAAARGNGLGRQLMQAAEKLARDHGCIGIWLDTFNFQAPGFYERIGFSRVGTIMDHPVGGGRHIYQKRLDG